MGLDMNLRVLSKKFSEEKFNDVMKVFYKNETDLKSFMEEGKSILSNSSYKDETAYKFFVENGFCSPKYALKFEPLLKEDFNNLTEDDIDEISVFPVDMKIDEKLCLTNSYEWYLSEVEAQKVDVFTECIKELELRLKNAQKELDKMEELYDELLGLDYEDIAYWRKHSDLNGYFEEIYKKRGGEGRFNCESLYLSKEDVKDLVELHKRHLDKNDEFRFKEFRGFFWGESDDSHWKKSLNDFEKVLKTVDWENQTVYYDCWW